MGWAALLGRGVAFRPRYLAWPQGHVNTGATRRPVNRPLSASNLLLFPFFACFLLCIVSYTVIEKSLDCLS